jgi:hypothetical protein
MKRENGFMGDFMLISLSLSLFLVYQFSGALYRMGQLMKDNSVPVKVSRPLSYSEWDRVREAVSRPIVRSGN